MPPDIQRSLPWSGEGHFGVWRYLTSHSQLILRQFRRIGSEFTQVTFEGVEWMETGQSYPGGITLTEAPDRGQRPTLVAYPRRLLLVDLTSLDGKIGFVAAHQLRIVQVSADDRELEVLLNMRAHQRHDPASQSEPQVS